MAVKQAFTSFGSGKRVVFVVLCAAAFATSASRWAHAVDGTWNPTGFAGNGTGLWSDGTKWTGGVIANGAGSQANFSTLNITSDSTVSLDSSRTIGRLLFGDTTASNNWFLDNNGNVANVLTLDNTGGTGAPKITVNNQTTTISAILAGTNGVTLTGGINSPATSATLVLSGANTYSGQTTLNSITPSTQQFTVLLQNNTALGTGNIFFDPGSANGLRLTLDSGVTISNPITLNTVRSVAGNAALRVNGNVTGTFSGPITINSTAFATSGGHFGGAAEPAFNPTGNFLNITNAITSNLALTAKNVTTNSGRLQVRSGQVRLSGGGNYLGMELRAGAIQLGATNGMSTSAYLDIGGNSEGNPQNYAVLDLNGFNQSLVGLSNYVGSLSDIRPATVTNSSFTTASTLTLAPADPTSNPNQANLVLQSSATGSGADLVQLTNQSTSAPLNLVINGAATGTQYMITPRSGYTGTTTLTSGTLAVSSLADGGVTASLTTTAGSTTATVDTTAGLVVGQLVVSDGVRTTGFNGAGGGPTTITAIDTGTNTVTLANAATQSGTFVSAFGTANTLGISTSAASNLVFNGGTLRYTNTSLNSTNGTINLTNSTTPTTNRNFTINNGSSGTIEVTNAATTLTMSGGSAATTGSLSKTGAGTLVLSGANAHTGGTTVGAGNLLVNGSLSTGTTSVLSGASLSGNGTIGGVVNLASGAIFAPGTGVGNVTAGGLTLNSGSFSNFEFDGVNNDTVTVTNPGGLNITGGNLDLYNVGAITPYSTNGTYTLMNINGGFSGSLSNFTIANAVAGKFYNLTNSPTSAIQLTIGDATTINWNGNSNSSWTLGGNWVGGISPNAVGTSVRFNGGNLTGAGSTTISVDGGGKTASGVIFNDDSSGTSFNVTGPGTLTLNNGVAAANINVVGGANSVSAPLASTNTLSVVLANGSSLSDSGGISGGKPLSVSGTGTVTLTGANSYSSTAISSATANSATLNVGTFGGSDTTGTLGTGAVTMSGGSVLNLNRSNAYSFAGGITGSGVGAGSVNQLGTGTTTVAGVVSNVTTVNVSAGALTTSSTVNQTGGINVTGTGSYTANGGISGAGGLTVNTTGAVALNASNSYTGGTSIGTTGGTVTLNAAGALPTNSALGVDGGTLNLNANNISVTSFLDTVAGGTIVNNGGVASTSTITYNATASSDDIYAALNNGVSGGKIAVVSSISNSQSGNLFTLHFHSASTYSGGTTVNSQNIQAETSNAFGAGPIFVAQNNASTNSSQIYLVPGVSISNNITIAQGNPFPVNGTGTRGVIEQTAPGDDTHLFGTVTIQANNFTGGLFRGPDVGSGNWMHVHGAVLTSGTADTIIQRDGQVRYYAGGNYANFAVNGLAQLGATNGLNPSAVIQFSTIQGGILDLGGFDQTVVGLSATGGNPAAVQNTGAGTNTLTLNTSGSQSYNGTIDGSINLTVGGSGTQTLTGVNTYTGDTRVQGGTLSITNPYLADAADVYVSNGALFDLSFAGNDIIDSLFLSGTPAAVGTWGGPSSGAAHISSLLSGTGILDVQTLGTAPGVPGDYNNNGTVDAADYVMWRKGGPLQNDPTPGVQPGDYTFWRSRFGAISGSGSTVSGGAVPEPSSAAVFLALLAICACNHRLRLKTDMRVLLCR